MSSVERFRTVGHSAPTTLDVALEEEKFPLTQRVVDTRQNNNTIGYLFREIEYHEKPAALIFSGRGMNRHTTRSFNDWLAEEQSFRNPYKWVLASGPTILEICYRINLEKNELAKEMNNYVFSIFSSDPYTRTTVQYEKEYLRITHDGRKYSTVPFTNEECILTNNNAPTTDALLFALFGKRYPLTNRIFGAYKSPIELLVPDKKRVTKCPLLLSTNSTPGYLFSGNRDKFTINIKTNCVDSRSAICVTPASNILNDPRYEVRDE